MVPFLRKFFPSVLRKEGGTKPNIYCVYDSQVLTAFTSSLYIAGLVASLVASRLAKIFGRRNVMLLGVVPSLQGLPSMVELSMLSCLSWVVSC